MADSRTRAACFCGEPLASICPWLLKYGPRKGDPCNLRLCRAHDHGGMCAWHRMLTDNGGGNFTRPTEEH
jgi:hypothetical protein